MFNDSLTIYITKEKKKLKDGGIVAGGNLILSRRVRRSGHEISEDTMTFCLTSPGMLRRNGKKSVSERKDEDHGCSTLRVF